MQNNQIPIYTISVTAQLVGVHQETLRIWERNGLISPKRRNNHRLYSNNDIRRLNFIKSLLDDKGLNLAGIRQLLEFYPCWSKENCKGGRKRDSVEYKNFSKPCWKEEDTFCFTPLEHIDYCENCTLCEKCLENCVQSNK